MRMSDWSSGVCSSDLSARHGLPRKHQGRRSRRTVVVYGKPRDAGHADLVEAALTGRGITIDVAGISLLDLGIRDTSVGQRGAYRCCRHVWIWLADTRFDARGFPDPDGKHDKHRRSEELTSELQSLMRVPYPVFRMNTQIQTT